MRLVHGAQGWRLAFFIGFVAFSGLCQASGTMEKTSNEDGNIQQKKYEKIGEEKLISQGVSAVRQLVENGNKASFRYLYINHDMENPILCGEVNQPVTGKASSGYQRFVHDMGTGTLGFENESTAFPLTWQVFCD
ncbi:hypothetical protein [Modicisalibacter xianhensis]|uniref:Uncharacterized protein n=1 Tax=Modicisalibacter xianhensis TaxID=442341 RepID=A0A1I3ADJ5_9GAMM|nr:hypothetical protein [Halomonas xianhensis]SFH48035.1 hypothetical protein SAMN04487959_104302 [Halomonas xianhensis]